jgi:TIR domain-containing protein/bDLD-like protein
MSGIPSHLMISLREALADCEPFETNRSLRNLFADTRLSPWRNSLPQADTLTERVDGVISYLHDKKHRDGSNALISLLLVLAERMEVEDDRRDQLVKLAKKLGQPVSMLVNAGKSTEEIPVEATRFGLPVGEAKLETSSLSGKRDFFISYNRHDQQWAEWIAWQLENAGYTTFIQAWDFRPGGNFVADMQEAAAKSERTIAVLSDTYLASQFTQPEWNAAFAQDPTGKQGLLLPVKVRDCDPKGLLSQIVYIDLTGISPEQATERLLAGVKHGRAKPSTAPGFPGTAAPEEPPFPKNT